MVHRDGAGRSLFSRGVCEMCTSPSHTLRGARELTLYMSVRLTY